MTRTICRSLRFDLLGKTLLALTIAFAALYVLPASIEGIARTVSAAETAEVWWPSPGASVEGVQPWKAIVKDKALADYDMYWQVDGGDLVKMYDSQTDYPHKESMVDVSGWKWNSNGSYAVTFVAKDRSGSEIARNTVSILNKAQAVSAPLPAPAPAPLPAPTPTVSAPIQTLSNPTASATLPKATETARLAKVTYPLVGARLTGTHPLKAIVIGLPLSAYKMYWSIDGGKETELYDSSVGGLHKEAMIDFTSWTWKGSSPYVIKVVARNSQGIEIAKTSVLIYANSGSSSTTTTAAAPVATTVSTTPVASATVPVAQAPVASVSMTSKLYVDPNNPAIAQAKAWRSSRPTDAGIMDKIGAQSTGIWLGGWNADVESDVRTTMQKAQSQGQIPTFVAYNIPGRDCGQHSAGGLSGRDAYLAWVKKIASGIGSGSAIVILEPDAITLMDCLSDSGKTDRFSMISSAIDILAANAGTKVYVDAGHAKWLSSSEVSSRLNKAGIAKAAGFALNTSNFIPTSDNTAYGTEVSKATGGKHFVIDTSRNGNGSNGEWCNPSGRALGQAPTLSTGNPIVDAYLWVKKPGESDGNCNGGPSAGTWWPEYALELAKRAGY